MSQDLVDHGPLRDEGDEAHGAVARWARERVDCEALLPPGRPAVGRLGRLPSWRGDDHGRRIGHDGLGLAAHAARAIGVPAVVPRGHVALVRNVGQRPRQELQGVRGFLSLIAERLALDEGRKDCTGGTNRGPRRHGRAAPQRQEYGDGLKKNVDNEAGDFIFIEPGVPHEVLNLSATGPVVAVVARSDASEWEHIIEVPSGRRPTWRLTSGCRYQCDNPTGFMNAAAVDAATSKRITFTMSGTTDSAAIVASIIALRRQVLGIITPYATIDSADSPPLYTPRLSAVAGSTATSDGKSAYRSPRRRRNLLRFARSRHTSRLVQGAPRHRCSGMGRRSVHLNRRRGQAHCGNNRLNY